jgi:hypothetical protein
MKAMDDVIEGNRTTIRNSLRGTHSLKKIHKTHGIPWTKDLADQGTTTRRFARFLVKYLSNIRNEMKKQADDAERQDRDARRETGMERPDALRPRR